MYKYYEVILVDPSHKAVRRDARINWICNPVHKRRDARGLTAEGKKNRGLGKGHRHNHQPKKASWRRHNTCASISILRFWSQWLTSPSQSLAPPLPLSRGRLSVLFPGLSSLLRSSLADVLSQLLSACSAISLVIRELVAVHVPACAGAHLALPSFHLDRCMRATPTLRSLEQTLRSFRSVRFRPDLQMETVNYL